MKQVKWTEWVPRDAEDGTVLMQDMMDCLPGAQPGEVSRIVRLFENPESPVALPGAISLPRHDCVHIVLGRGLLPQDEAFVIGFTMGTSKKIGPLSRRLFGLISKYLYPKYYKFSDEHLQIFDLGLEYGKMSKVDQIYEFPFEDYMHQTVGEIRDRLGLDMAQLLKCYREEVAMIPNSKESKRLQEWVKL